jgi:hypothetical protein
VEREGRRSWLSIHRNSRRFWDAQWAIQGGHFGLLLHIGDKLDLDKAMAGAGQLAPAEVAKQTGTAERYVREWLCNQTAKAFPKSTFMPSTTTPPPSSGLDAQQRRQISLISFDVAGGKTYPGSGYDLATFFDCLHDRGIRSALGVMWALCRGLHGRQYDSALGAQAGEQCLRQVFLDGGFSRFRRATETPFNLIFEVRP